MNDQSNLDWQAFCYAAGDLDAAAAEQFEARLADEQLAREALARAVELTQTITASEAHAPVVALAPRTNIRWQSRVSWMAIGGLAAALLAMLWSSVVEPTVNNARQTLTARSHQHLAEAWTQTRQQWSGASASEIWSDFDLPPELEEATADSREEESDFAEAPSWMMAAVYARSASTDSQSTERLEN